MTDKPKTTLTCPTDRELVFTRLFDAPRELVWQAWTDPKHIAQWWGPKGFTTTTHEMDFKPGGVWRLTMRGPDGTDYHNRIVYVEITKPSRLVFKHVPEAGDEQVWHETTVTFDLVGKQTKVAMSLRFESGAILKQLNEKYHADEGGIQTIERLGEYLATMN